jgi:hypothetical protein
MGDGWHNGQRDVRKAGNIDTDTAERVARLEAWVEVAMRALASLGLETVLTELDQARGAYRGEADESCAAG